MSISKHETNKSVVYSFDGFSEAYQAFVQGAFAGKYIVPKQHAHLIREGQELDDLRDLHADRRYGVVLRQHGNVW